MKVGNGFQMDGEDVLGALLKLNFSKKMLSLYIVSHMFKEVSHYFN